MVFTNNIRDLKLIHKGDFSQMDNKENDFNNFEHQPNHEQNTRHARQLRNFNDYNSRYDNEEFASELLADNGALDGNSTSGAMISGGLGIVAGLVAMFMYPMILGLTAIGLGGYAFAKGNKTGGVISVIMGVIAAAAPLFFGGAFYSMF